MAASSPFNLLRSPAPAPRPWRLEELCPGFELRYFSYGRRALAASLRAAGVGRGARVLLPELICREALPALAAVGAAPAFYPVGPGLAPSARPEDWPEAAAVVAVDYFGFPQDLAPFRAYAARTGALVIEDNAHGLFSRDREGRLLGTRADAGIFSLRKTLPLPDGAALAVRAGARAWDLAPQSPFGARAGVAQSVKGALRRLDAACAWMPGYRALRVFRALRGLLHGGLQEGSESELPPPELPCAELSAPIVAADPALEVERRRALYRLVEAALAPHAAPLFPALEEGTSPYGFVYRAGEGAARARRILAGLCLDALPWPLLPDAIRARAPRHYLDIRFVPFLPI